MRRARLGQGHLVLLVGEVDLEGPADDQGPAHEGDDEDDLLPEEATPVLDTRGSHGQASRQIPCSGKIFSWMVSTWRRAYSAAHRRVSSGSSTGGSQRVIA